MLDFGTSKSNSEVSKSKSNTFVENYFFLENCVSSEEAVSHYVLDYQQLCIACYQVHFYAHNYFEYVLIVFTAFKGSGHYCMVLRDIYAIYYCEFTIYL